MHRVAVSREYLFETVAKSVACKKLGMHASPMLAVSFDALYRYEQTLSRATWAFGRRLLFQGDHVSPDQDMTRSMKWQQYRM
jgi:hypothetical protein